MAGLPGPARPNKARPCPGTRPGPFCEARMRAELARETSGDPHRAARMPHGTGGCGTNRRRQTRGTTCTAPPRPVAVGSRPLALRRGGYHHQVLRGALIRAHPREEPSGFFRTKFQNTSTGVLNTHMAVEDSDGVLLWDRRPQGASAELGIPRRGGWLHQSSRQAARARRHTADRGVVIRDTTRAGA